jgi:phospholipid-binding lipoprotein MlaA
MRGICAFAAAMCALVLSGCAGTPEMQEANDPLEPMNRQVFALNEKFDHYVELPIAGVYIFWVPMPLRRGLDHVFTNLELPAVFANDVLQGEATRAGQAFVRFTVNSTIGIGGVFDVAGRTELPYQPADFGQTLATYGVGEGPFLVVPIVGPDPPRDLLGDAVDFAADPLTYVPPRWPFYLRFTDAALVHAGSTIETNARNIVLRQELEKSSLDPYVTMRSVYRQMRAAQIAGRIPPDSSAGNH